MTAPLDTAAKVQVAAQLARIPDVLQDEEDGTVTFVQVDVFAKEAIKSHLGPNTAAEFIPRRVPTEKALCDTSIAPTLGLDTTLPQYRISTTTTSTRKEIQQNTYPVPYFFYGTLTEPNRLQRLFNLDAVQPALLTPVIVRGGKVRMWGEYRALVDAGEKEVVEGWMYEVQNKEHEDALRFYEGMEYEVVRCDMMVKGKGKGERLEGLTFRFCGDEGVLTG
ncbi:aig2-like protein [Stemphylium lycopersici]|uniref:Putative gamma-glutamylcyclotransferase n=1 Tax=Stemphylium lycopersici TaxID=183478 RepID=A0A364N1B0_STELY|nr:aig2-like protein [Stemphylium lycopersici]